MRLRLKIITQEAVLLEQEIDSLTVPSVTGQLTLLPNHIPLLTKLLTGEVVYRDQGKEFSIVIADGILELGPDNRVTILADSAVRSQDINVLKAQEAKERAEDMMKQKLDTRDFMLAEASLRRALMEIQTYNKIKRPH